MSSRNWIFILLCALLFSVACSKEKEETHSGIEVMILKQGDVFLIDEGSKDVTFSITYLENLNSRDVSRVIIISDMREDTGPVHQTEEEIQAWCDESSVELIYWRPHGVFMKDCEHCQYLQDREGRVNVEVTQ